MQSWCLPLGVQRQTEVSALGTDPRQTTYSDLANSTTKRQFEIDVHVFCSDSDQTRSSQMRASALPFQAHSQHYLFGILSLCIFGQRLENFDVWQLWFEENSLACPFKSCRLCPWNGACRLAMRIKNARRLGLALYNKRH